jgi:hypothetical protein
MVRAAKVSGTFGIGKGEGVVEADLPQGVQDVGELSFAFAAKADQDIGGDRHPGQSGAQGSHQIVVLGEVVTPSHACQYRVRRRLQGQVHVLADLG